MVDTVLIVDDEETLRDLCADALGEAGYDVRLAASADDALSVLDGGGIDVVLTDLQMPGMSGIDFLRIVRERYSSVDVVMMTGYASVPTAVEALKLGAQDYITKPFGLDDLANRIHRVVERRELMVENRLMREHLQKGVGPGGIIGASPSMQSMFRLIMKLAPRSQPVLVTGESGTGKELVARAIHECSPRSSHPFVPVDCGAINPQLIESELFGHTSGAFTGAAQRRIGLVPSAGKGTLFLDEIGELPLDVQAKLLRLLQEREFRAVGSNRQESFEARILAATNRDLQEMVRAGKFRSDLYFRLNVLAVTPPPLRERSDDIPALAQAFIERERRQGDAVVGIARDALSRLQAYAWPGNVRELQNHIQRAVALAEGPLIQIADLAPEIRGSRAAGPVGERSYLEELERKAIADMLRRAAGNRMEAAKLLGISKTTLYKKIREYAIEEAAYDSAEQGVLA